MCLLEGLGLSRPFFPSGEAKREGLDTVHGDPLPQRSPGERDTEAVLPRHWPWVSGGEEQQPQRT